MSSIMDFRFLAGLAAGALAYTLLKDHQAPQLAKKKSALKGKSMKKVDSDANKSDSEYLPVDRLESVVSSTGADSDESSSEKGEEKMERKKSYSAKHKCSDKIEGHFMDAAVEEAQCGLCFGEGGPFGACITSHGKVIARAHNMVLQTNDPTAHAEVTCIRKAAARLGRFDLSDCVLYTSCEPCPMCFGAIHWAKIPVCVYAADRNDAAEAGFDDAFIYDAIKGTAEEEHVKMVHCPHQGAVDVFSAKFDSY